MTLCVNSTVGNNGHPNVENGRSTQQNSNLFLKCHLIYIFPSLVKFIYCLKNVPLCVGSAFYTLRGK